MVCDFHHPSAFEEVSQYASLSRACLTLCLLLRLECDILIAEVLLGLLWLLQWLLLTG